jgi:transposase
MSLKTPIPSRIPAQTAGFVEPLLAKDSIYRFVGQEIDQIIGGEEFADVYAEEGCPGVNPVILALVTVFQFLEKLPDRRAAQMAVMRWTGSMRCVRNWIGKAFTMATSATFANACCGISVKSIYWSKLWTICGGMAISQRTDSTHILGAVRSLSTADLVRETLYVTLRALIGTDAPWTLGYLPASFVETYAPRQHLDWKGKAELTEQLQRMAQDGEWLLEQVSALARQPCKEWLKSKDCDGS